MSLPDKTEGEVEQNNKALVLRNYQIALVETCYSTNSIVFLPTGSGKTCIATHTLMHFADRLVGSLTSGAKRALFMVPTKALVFQQSHTLETQTPLIVGKYTGDIGIDHWSKARWHAEFENHQVLVMTPTIMQIVLKNAYIALDQLAIIIVDECHNGVDDHAFRAVMKEMQCVPEHDQPRILGLTATLLNRTISKDKVAEEIRSLETTYHAQIATCEQLEEVLKFSARPKTRHVAFPSVKSSVPLYLKEIQESCLIPLRLIAAQQEEQVKSKTPEGYLHHRGKTIANTVDKAFKDIDDIYQNMGIYAASVAVIYHLLEFEQKRIMADTTVHVMCYGLITTALNSLRSTLMTMMGDDNGPQSVLKFSTLKLKSLFEELKSTGDSTAIIFLTRRSSAICLAHIIKKLSGTTAPNSGVEGFTHLKPAFIVGGRANPMANTFETTFESLWQQRTLKRFANGEVNLLVATSVVEEGVDIPMCNRVYRFDIGDLHYRSYIQAKGRARSQTGEFVVFVPDKDVHKHAQKKRDFDEIEEELYRILIGKYKERSAPSQDQIEDVLYYEDVEPYYVNGPGSSHVTGVMSIPCVSRYCNSLPQDLFSCLSPTFFWKPCSGGKVVCAVQMPIMSPVKELILGKPMKTRKLAKRSAFVETVKLLHQAKELTDDLKPVVFNTDNASFDWLFPHYQKEITTGGVLPGTKRRRQYYQNKYPSALTGCVPSLGMQCYLHVIEFAPAYATPTPNKHRVFHGLLAAPNTYAILSTKPMPQICDFSLYMSAGEVTCRVVGSAVTVTVDAQQIQQIRYYHFHLFTSVCMERYVPAMKDCFVLMNSNKDNSFYIVPVMKANQKYQVDWDTVQNIEELTCELDMTDVTPERHTSAVINPYYRGDDMLYMVTDVLTNLSPVSCFPDRNDKTFACYYAEKYGRVIQNLEQPLVEVKRLPKLSGCFMRPRSQQSVGIRGRRKLLAEDEDYDETFVPELCKWYRYPGVLWVKAILLPTALHRITALLNMEELFSTLEREAGVGVKPVVWAPLVPDDRGTTHTVAQATSTRAFPTALSKKARVNRPVPDRPALLYDNEPMNIYEDMEKVADCDLKKYVDVMSKGKGQHLNTPNKKADGKVIERPSVPTLDLKLLQLNYTPGSGPELRTLLAAFTALSANDIVNLERLETLGDSFLKFMVSLFLFRQFPSWNEGELTSTKSKMVSNRNLLYCAQHRKLPSMILVNDFSVLGEWVPPLCAVPGEVADEIRAKQKDPMVLDDVVTLIEEKLSGTLSADNLKAIKKHLSGAESISIETMVGRSCSILQQKIISDKSVADCAEAFIGTYLAASGIKHSVKVLNWLGIIPCDSQGCGRAQDLFDVAAPSPVLRGATDAHVMTQLCKVQYRKLEAVLGYTFKNKAYLLQAITHPTFGFHRVTDCYQRLEFLGDAVIDFLVTSFIWQEASYLGPGDITMLRSSLVSNTTLACMTVKYGMYRYLLRLCPPLDEAIDAFVALQENRGHVVDEAVSPSKVLLTLEERDVSVAQSVEVAKALGDMFESLAGAIYLDSGNSLCAVWEFIYPLMKEQFDLFVVTIPRTSVQLMHELPLKDLQISISEVQQGTIRARVVITLLDGKVLTCYGFGSNKEEAKRSGAKIAVRKYQTAMMAAP